MSHPVSEICALDLSLRHAALLRWDAEGFAWDVHSTRPRASPGEPYAAAYDDQEAAEELAAWLRESLLERSPEHGIPTLVAVELATNAKSAAALATMMLARGAFAGVGADLRRRGVRVEYVVQNHSRDAALAVRPRPVRVRAGATKEELRAAGRQRQENRRAVKAGVRAHVLHHFPELRDFVVASVGALAEHVYDAATVLIAAAWRPSATCIDPERRGRLLAAHARREAERVKEPVEFRP